MAWRVSVHKVFMISTGWHVAPWPKGRRVGPIWRLQLSLVLFSMGEAMLIGMWPWDMHLTFSVTVLNGHYETFAFSP